MPWEFISKAGHISQEEFQDCSRSIEQNEARYFIFMARLKLSWKNFLECRIQNLSSVLWNRETSKPKPRSAQEDADMCAATLGETSAYHRQAQQSRLGSREGCNRSAAENQVHSGNLKAVTGDTSSAWC